MSSTYTATFSNAVVGKFYIFSYDGAQTISPTVTGGTIVNSITFATPVSENWIGRTLIIKATATTIKVDGKAKNGIQYTGQWMEIN